MSNLRGQPFTAGAPASLILPLYWEAPASHSALLALFLKPRTGQVHHTSASWRWTCSSQGLGTSPCELDLFLITDNCAMCHMTRRCADCSWIELIVWLLFLHISNSKANQKIGLHSYFQYEVYITSIIKAKSSFWIFKSWFIFTINYFPVFWFPIESKSLQWLTSEHHGTHLLSVWKVSIPAQIHRV